MRTPARPRGGSLIAALLLVAAPAAPGATPAQTAPAPPEETTPSAASQAAPTAPAATLPAAVPAPSPSEACDGAGRRGWMLRQSLIGLTNPIGAVAETKAGWCKPLVRRPGLLFRLTQVEAGALAFLTPSFLRGGGYLEVAPLSFLVLRFSATGVGYWPLPGFRVAAYFDAHGYGTRWPSNGFTNDYSPPKEGGGGLNLSAQIVLRASVPLARLPRGPVELIAVGSLAAEYWYFPGYAYYYNQRADAVLARSDVALVESAALLLGFPLTRKAGMRVGVTNSLAWLPRPGRLAHHQVGGLLMWPLTLASPRVAGLTPFLRVTGYTTHYTRELSLALNVLIGAELALRL